MIQDIQTLLNNLFQNKKLLFAVISSPVSKNKEIQKITIRPLQIKNTLFYQITQFQGPKAIHSNVDPAECKKLIASFLETDFKQALLCTGESDYHILISKKGQATLLTKAPTRSSVPLLHNREKQYVITEGVPVPFLVELGVMSAEGKVIAKKSDKFKQINRFLEMIEDILPHLPKSKTLHIIDFGCGKAYLTFALYHYLSCMHDYKLDVHGLDLKEDVINFCQNLADKLQYKGLQFSVGDIEHFQPKGKVDLMIALHACDTATDIAIAQAVNWDADAILCVPCCQKELAGQIHNPDLAPILKHGILKERFAALATDAARAQLLEISGYHTQVLEFIDLEHTPKNLLIRAIKSKAKMSSRSEKSLQEYRAFRKALHITPYLEKALKIL